MTPPGDAAEFLLRRAREADGGVLAIVGTAKNVGKTSAVRAALRRADSGAAVCSIGRDGELHDALDGREKPTHDLMPGMLAVTSAECLAPGRFAICARVDARSAAGPLYVARALIRTPVRTRGPRSGVGVARMLAALREHGARVIFCDGALDRMTGVLGAGGARTLILATGASLARGVAAVVAETAAHVERLTLPAPPPDCRATEFAGVVDERAARGLDPAIEAIVVESPVMLTREAHAILRDRRLYARAPLRIAALAQCAFAPDAALDPATLERALHARTGLPVIDVLRDTVYGA